MTAARLTGLDLARAWAWLGMLVVNFRVAMGVDKDPNAPAWLQAAVEALSGRAAAPWCSAYRDPSGPGSLPDWC